jgi:hypothetical protein
VVLSTGCERSCLAEAEGFEPPDGINRLSLSRSATHRSSSIATLLYLGKGAAATFGDAWRTATNATTIATGGREQYE